MAIAGLAACLLLSVSGTATGATAPSPAAAAAAPTPIIVAVGDSYISGEGARWAGNVESLLNNQYAYVKYGSVTKDNVYWDTPTGEKIRGCHRSRVSPITWVPKYRVVNLACSGARTSTTPAKIGVDFYQPPADWKVRKANPDKGQALQLQEFAAKNKAAKFVIVVSVGGNDLPFFTIVQSCVKHFDGDRKKCADDATLAKYLTPQALSALQDKLVTAYSNVQEAMANAGVSPENYIIAAQLYPRILPNPQSTRSVTSTYRYDEGRATRGWKGGCPFFDSDSTWAMDTVLDALDAQVVSAVNESRAFGAAWWGSAPKAVIVNPTTALQGHRLCQTGTSPASKTKPAMQGAGTAMEWITQIRAGSPGESLHPNFWGQRVLGRCLQVVVAERWRSTSGAVYQYNCPQINT
jgi:hypothetical protein